MRRNVGATPTRATLRTWALPLLLAACWEAPRPKSGDAAPGAPTTHAGTTEHARYVSSFEVKAGPCDLSHTVPPVAAFGVTRHADAFWCAGESAQCWTEKAMCERLAWNTETCTPSGESHCFVDRGGCNDGVLAFGAACYRSVDACNRALPVLGAEGSTCHAMRTTDAATTKPGSHWPTDCTGKTKNSDGSPRTAPPGPPSSPPEALVFRYDDFGPQASAGKLIGQGWWSWEGGGSWQQCDDFDIRVVVYRGVSLEAVEARYPSARSKADLVERGLADYRYVEYGEVIRHLDEEIRFLAGDAVLERLRDELRATRERIVRELGRELR